MYHFFLHSTIQAGAKRMAQTSKQKLLQLRVRLRHALPHSQYRPHGKRVHFIMHPLGFLQIFYSGKQPGSQAAAGLDAHFLHFILARDHIAAHFFEPLGGQFFQLVVHQIEA